MSRVVGRTRPYTKRGIARLACIRCGRRAHHQWSLPCAAGNRWVPVCVPCDVALNGLAMRFMRVPGWRRLMRAYAKRWRDQS